MAEKIIYSIIVFGLLVLFHELGHFSIAKLTGVQVYEFSIGFGPRLAGFRWGETCYNIRIVPLGGFVRMAGMDPEEDRREAEKLTDRDEGSQALNSQEDCETAPFSVSPERSFMHKTVGKRMGIIAAGPLMNFVLAIMLFALSFLIYGLPTNKNIVGGVLENRPAQQAGIKPGDVIQKINGSKIETWEDLTSKIHTNAEKKIKLEIKRGNEIVNIQLIPKKDPESQRGQIGITYMSEKIGVMESLKLGVLKTYQMLQLTVHFIGKMVAKEMPVQLSGPVRITYELGKAADMGLIFLMNFAGFLSIQIGLFNLLPIPALDGSRLLFLVFEGVRGTPIDPSRENFIHLVGLAVLLLLMVVITYQDIVQMFG